MELIFFYAKECSTQLGTQLEQFQAAWRCINIGNEKLEMLETTRH